MTEITVAATQMACTWDLEKNVAAAVELVREAAGRGARIVLLQELFETPYFCKDRSQAHFALARPAPDHPLLARMSALAAELGVVLPVSFFERANAAYFNSLAVIDADGRNLGLYRKSHIPDGPGYREKFYFTPGDTGFKVWHTRHATIGAAVCWDQWFPEAARAMALKGAELLFYPTAIGSEPQDPGLDSRDHWQRAMQGHAAANMVPLIASNRIGREDGESCALTLLWLVLHRRSDRRQARRGGPRRARRHHRDLRPRGHPRPARRLGSVPRPPPGTLRRADDLGWGQRAGLGYLRSSPARVFGHDRAVRAYYLEDCRTPG